MRTDYIDKADGTDKDYYMLVIDENGFIQFANSYFISNLELKAEKIQEKSFFKFLGAKHLKSFKDSITHVQKTSNAVSIDISAINGSHHWMKLEISKYKNGADGSNKYFCIGYDIVGKARVKKMKNMANRNYDAIMEGLTIGVIMQDVNGDVLAANQKAAEIFDTSIETLYESNEFKNLWNCVQNESGVVSYENSPAIRALLTRELQKDVRVTLKTDDGKLKTLLINSQPLFEENNSEPTSVVTSITDISRENELENEVHQQEILFNTFKDNTPNLAWMVDEEGRLMFANKSFYKYLGLSESSIGKNILEMVPEVIAEALEIKHRQVLETGLAQKIKETMFLADGTEIVFWINIFPVDMVSGKRMIGGEAINITNHHKAEQQLQHAKESLHNLSHVTTDAIWEWDMQTGEIFRNQNLMDLIGFSPKSSFSLGWWFKRIHPDDRRKVRDTIKNVVDKKLKSWASEYRFKKATGDYINVIDKGFVIFENELAVKMIGSLSDVSQLKELESKLIDEQIRRQKDITETIFSVQEKERTRIGHELHDNVNQILSTCKLFMDMIKTSTPEDDDLKGKVKEYILSAIEEIRKLSKEMVTPQLKENGLIASINTLVDDLKATNAMNVFFYHQDEVEVISNGKKVTLFRIVQEQIKNTLKYSKAKNLTIHLYTIDDDIQLLVEDDGVGFEAKQTRRGIGLSNIYERTRFYNGKLQIKTAPGQGCKMIVDIPVFD